MSRMDTKALYLCGLFLKGVYLGRGRDGPGKNKKFKIWNRSSYIFSCFYLHSSERCLDSKGRSNYYAIYLEVTVCLLACTPATDLYHFFSHKKKENQITRWHREITSHDLYASLAFNCAFLKMKSNSNNTATCDFRYPSVKRAIVSQSINEHRLG